MAEFPHLFSPIRLGGTLLANRAIMGSMHTNLEEAGDWNRVAAFYAERAEGGAGLIVTGGIAPNPEGAVFPGAAGLSSAEDIAHHRQVTGRVHDAGGRIALQILHAGRYGYGPDCVAPSAIRSPISPFTPHALDEAGIERQIADFVATARRAQDAGYDGVEIMGSEGYLINQFLAARTNRRTDRWGGSYENRMRLPLSVVEGVRRAVGGDFIVIYRLSVIDLLPDGSDWDEVVTLARAVEAAGASAINSGIGWHEARIPTIATSVPRHGWSWVTAKLMGRIGIPLIASNRINRPEVAEGILARGEADMVSMARPFLADAAFMRKAAEGRAVAIAPCIACNQACLDHTFAGRVSSCLVNPRACHETELMILPAPAPRRIAVVGAGPAGLSAALTLDGRGHEVTLFERSADLGGQLRLAARVPGKEEFRALIDWYRHELSQSRIRARFGQPAGPADLAAFDEVVIATGVRPRLPDIPTDPGAPLARYDEILEGTVHAGPRVAIIGAGGIGFDVAAFLVEGRPSPTLRPAEWRTEWGVTDPALARGGVTGARPAPPLRQVTLLQRKAERPGRGLGKTTGWIHRATLAAKEVRMIGGVNYERITAGGLAISFGAERRDPQFLPADTIVFCTGQVSERSLAGLSAPRHHVIGGAAHAAELDAKRAIDEAVRLGARL